MNGHCAVDCETKCIYKIKENTEWLVGIGRKGKGPEVCSKLDKVDVELCLYITS